MIAFCPALTFVLNLNLVFSQDRAAESSPADPGGAAAATGFLFKSLDLDGEKYNYSIFVPPTYTPDKAWPVILFLHGSGERGTDGLLQTEVGIGRAIRRNWSRIPAIVIMPQCRPGKSWDGAMANMALKCIEQTSRDYRMDPARIYLTGLSLGGFGTWHIASLLPDRFAAIVPVCGFVGKGPEATDEARKIAPKIATIPTWVFHGDKDDAVPVDRSREMVAALKAAGGKPFYTEVPGGNHNVWDRAYDDAEMWKWLFAQKREAKAGN